MSSIITAEQVSERTGADTTTAGLIADAINDLIETNTGRHWGGEHTVTETYDASSVVWLRQMDITEVTSVKVGYPTSDRTLLSPSTYSFNEFGRLVLSFSPTKAIPPRTSDYVEVAYKHGVPADKVPGALVLAALNLASSYYTYSIEHGGQEVAEESIGSYRLSYRSAGQRANSRDWQVINAHAKRRL